MILAGLLASAPSLYGQKKAPYGPAQKSYGERQPVQSAGEARGKLQQYYKNRNLNVGTVKEREHFYEAEIRDRTGALVDKVIIDKRTGRIRSTF